MTKAELVVQVAPSALRQRLISGVRYATRPPTSLAHPTAARGEDDAPHRRRGIPRGLCSGGAGAKMAL